MPPINRAGCTKTYVPVGATHRFSGRIQLVYLKELSTGRRAMLAWVDGAFLETMYTRKQKVAALKDAMKVAKAITAQREAMAKEAASVPV